MSLETFVAEYQEAKKKFIEQAREEIGKEFKRIFTENPRLKCISWTQYTPWFNDGDSCTFSKNDFTFSSFVPEDAYYVDVEEDEFHEEYLSSYSLERRGDDMSSDVNWKDLCKFNELCNKEAIVEVFHDLFGDHVWVKATIDGFDVEDHEHD